MKMGLRVKRDADAVAKGHKSGLSVSGSRDQTELLNTFTPVVDFNIDRLMLSIAVERRWELHQVYC